MNTRTSIKAREGYILTNGKNIYGSEIFLAAGLQESDLYEITRAEYEEILNQETEKLLCEAEQEQ